MFELHRHAEIVRQRRCSRHVARAEDRQAETPDRAGDAAAVHDQLVEGLVLGAANIHLDAVDQIEQSFARERKAPLGVGEGDPHRAAILGLQLRSGIGEQLELALGGLVAVADVVDEARERVNRAHRPALGRGEQPDPVIEVARLLARQRFAVAVRVRN